MAERMDHEELVAQFAGIAGVPPREARQYLAANHWNLEAAVTEFYANQEEAGGDQDDDEDDPDYESEIESTPLAPQSTSAGGRRLGESASDLQPIPAAASSSQPSKKPPTSKKFATLGDFSGGSNGPNTDDAEEDEKQDLFAGGEKSGLAVQNPDDLKKKILQKAIQRSAPVAKEPKGASKNFTGAARTLGGDDAPSREIASEPRESPRSDRVDRILHFWNDGFSIDEGDLYRTDDPRNAEILNGIRQGRAPLHIMGVLPGQEVDVEIRQHQENYVKPKQKFVPFSGSGNRLGSPTPGAPPMPGAFTTGTTTTPAATQPPPPTTSHEIDEDQPTVTLRISLGDGTRLTSRFNTNQSIGDVYDFVRRADTSGREFVLQTTFPTKVLADWEEILGQMTEFKRGGVIVQKYT